MLSYSKPVAASINDPDSLWLQKMLSHVGQGNRQPVCRVKIHPQSNDDIWLSKMLAFSQEPPTSEISCLKPDDEWIARMIYLAEAV
jgi:hypothetical protein